MDDDDSDNVRLKITKLSWNSIIIPGAIPPGSLYHLECYLFASRFSGFRCHVHIVQLNLYGNSISNISGLSLLFSCCWFTI